jgi:hypothetical protein
MITMFVGEWSAEFEQECQATIAQRLTGPRDGMGFRARAHGIKLLGGLQPSLQACAIKRVLQVNRAKFAEHMNDFVLANVRGIRHGRSPVTGQSARVLMQEPRVFQHQCTNRVDIAAPDCIRHSASSGHTRPTRQTITAGENQLRIRKLGVFRRDCFGMMFLKLRKRRGLALLDGAKQVFCLVFELFKVRTNGKVTICQDGPPLVVPVVRCLGRKGDSQCL